MKYKKGDKVRIKTDESMPDRDKAMDKYKWAVMTITSLATDKLWYDYYRMEEDSWNRYRVDSQIKWLAEDELEEGDMVWVSIHSLEHAIKNKDERMYLCSVPWDFHWKHICVIGGDENRYREWKGFDYSWREYVVKVPKEEKEKKVSIALTEEQLKKVKDILGI